jgi:cbb3-type cytochrome oxidase maturation protein
MGLAGLAAFLWSMRSGQYDDLDGAAERVLLTVSADEPLQEEAEDHSVSRNGSSRIGIGSQSGIEGKRK